jgi:hypothetical protein
MSDDGSPLITIKMGVCYAKRFMEIDPENSFTKEKLLPRLIFLKNIFPTLSSSGGKHVILQPQSAAQVAELVDAADSKSAAARCAGSIPVLGTVKSL